MKTLKNFWNIIEGNKTIICMTTATVLQQAIKYDIINDSKGLQFAIGLSITFGGGSLWWHAKKGFFSKNKGK